MIRKTLTILAASCMMYSCETKQKATLSSLNFKQSMVFLPSIKSNWNITNPPF